MLDTLLNQPVFPGDTLRAASSMHFMGEAAPWTPATDPLVAPLLIALLLLVLLAVAAGRATLPQRLRGVLASAGSRTAQEAATSMVDSGERWRAVFYPLALAAVAAILHTTYVSLLRPPLVVLPPWRIWHLLAVQGGVALAVLMLRRAIYGWVHATFFTRLQRAHWGIAQRLSSGLETILLTLCTLAATSGRIGPEIVLWAAILSVFLPKMTLVWCAWRVFFGQKVLALHYFVYLCGAEIVPIVALWRLLDAFSRAMTI